MSQFNISVLKDQEDTIILHSEYQSVLYRKLPTRQQLVVPENTHSTPIRGIRFSRGRGEISLIFQGGGVCTIWKYFKWVLMAHKRVTKKKQKMTTTIYLR